MKNIKYIKRFGIYSLAVALSPFLFSLGNIKSSKADAAGETLSVSGKSAYLMDSDSCTEIYSYNADERLPIASMCKIMTLILCFDSIEDGTLSLSDKIPVSEHACSMGGSQVFLDSGVSYSCEELLKSIAICSANDSCVAMAEYIAGSDSEFVQRMNERASELGANDTLFSNCTGLPKEPQYSTAHDVALMLKELSKHEKYFEFCKVWNEDFVHPDNRVTQMTNTNKLIRTYKGINGGKTGFTNQAGFCLAASAMRGNMSIISVIIGSPSSKERFSDTTTLLDYAFANYMNRIIVDCSEPMENKIRVSGGKQEFVQVAPLYNGTVFSQKNKKEDVSIGYALEKQLKAPVNKGDRVGEIILFKNNVEYKRIPAVAYDSVDKASYGDILNKVSDSWNIL